MFSSPSHQQGKHWRVRGQQALEMLVIHAAAKRQRVKGCWESLPASLHVCVWRGGGWKMLSSSFIFPVIFVSNFQNLQRSCKRGETLQFLFVWKLDNGFGSSRVWRINSPSVNNEIKPWHHWDEQNISGGERQSWFGGAEEGMKGKKETWNNK